MPALETMDLYQRAVLWTSAGWDGFGQPKVNSPVEISVRWLDKKRNILDADGGTIALDVQVIAAQTIPVNSLLWLGTLVQFNIANVGSNPTLEICQVKVFNVSPDIKNRFKRYDYGLMRYKDHLPS